MIGSEMLRMMKLRLNRLTSGSPELDALIYAEIDAAQIRLEGTPTIPWWLISEEASFTLVAHDERAHVPLDFLREIETDNLRVEDPDSGVFYDDLKKGLLDESRRRWPGEGRPRAYVLSGEYFRMFPIPDKSYRIWMSYMAKADPVTPDTENKWLKNMPDLLMAEAGIVLAPALRNAGALELFKQLQADERARMVRENHARAQENFDPNPED